MRNSENWYTPDRLAYVNAAARRVRCKCITVAHEAWVVHAVSTQQGQRTLSSSTQTATNG